MEKQTGLNKDTLFAFFYLSRLLKLSVPVLDCIKQASEIASIQDQKIMDDLSKNILTKGEFEFSKVFESLNSIEAQILAEKATVGDRSGTIDDSLFEGAYLVLMYRKVKASKFNEKDISFLKWLIRDLDLEVLKADYQFESWSSSQFWQSAVWNSIDKADDINSVNWLLLQLEQDCSELDLKIFVSLLKQTNLGSVTDHEIHQAAYDLCLFKQNPYL